MDHPRPWLRYVEAGDLDNSTINFDDLDVKNAAGDDLGDVNGFILDADTGQPYYVVVDSGGWFSSKHYLLPIGHARLAGDRKALIADLTRDHIKKFPGFDLDKFEKWSDADMDNFNRETTAACCVDVTIVTTAPAPSWTASRHYEKPDWWDSNYYRPDRAGAKGVTAGAQWTPRETNAAERERAVVHDKPKR
jgi:hypothetical protein